ncbi:hypothetical protein HRI_000685400 [Hibiscus trionum]|uniref:Ubiquitin-like domain-containing protein n=1 Tax=Hibiscus trionum TaxID=183268 RepID=A0A9W7LNB2_HIBTR|nr:hypothetical protein HRI_000685400 [Hibiscus trionum]
MDTNGGQRVTAATESTLITLSSNRKDEKRILLKVQSGSEEAEHLHYWMGRNTPFSKLMLNYIQRLCVPLNSVRFLFDGSALNPYSVPSELQLEDGDSIDVIRRDEYISGSESTLIFLHDVPTISLPHAKYERVIRLEVLGLENDSDFVYLIGINTPLRHLMLDYCDRTAQVFEFMRFRLSFRFSDIDPNKTADDLNMSNGATI